ncbi:phosphoribosylglycinamide formyltransferase [Nocardia nova]|uniref:Phosphoribosylglycinamide formyltransferase n=1 Tax=Nocardia nova TaxID=37330 RepID=A0A2S6ARW1_9NOCA|nr:phosphoribosylglycinamide formyltransferase [Nocardia nova]PPJ37938.1 phosphoribosylglycinamide formyltransferase [Nocardia nova]
MRKLRVGVLVSHNGSNLRALHRSALEPGARFEIAVVIGNNSEAAGLAYARASRIPTRHLSGATHPDPDALDDAIRATLVEHAAEWVVTAGYMKKLGPSTRRQFDSRILNIHPAPLPRFGGVGMFGRRVHEAVLASGVAVTGPTVHLVDSDYDTGRVIAHREVPVLADDTAETLAARVLEAEHVVLPLVVRQIAAAQRL